MTLYGPSFGSVTKLCARWLSPIPVRPAITAGTHPPLGVIDTTHPSASADSIDVVPAWNDSRNAESLSGVEGVGGTTRSCWPLFGCESAGAKSLVRQAASCCANGFVPP